MNLAIRDVRHNLLRFALTGLGIALLTSAAMTMNGVYRGIVEDALLLINRVNADLWIVQGHTQGPFADTSSVSSSLRDRALGVQGVESARNYLSLSRRVEVRGSPRQVTVLGIDFPYDHGEWLPVEQGRALIAAHYEAVADISLGVAIGEELSIGYDRYRIVGLMRNMVEANGDPMLAVSLNDLRSIRAYKPSEAILLQRASGGSSEVLADGSSSSQVAATMLKFAPGVDALALRAQIDSWPDIATVSHAEQQDLVVNGRLERLRKQILLFTAILMIITAVVVTLIIYTLTLENLHTIAMLKLIGARNRVIVGMILQQSLMLGATGASAALLISNLWLPLFPRRIVLLADDVLLLQALVILTCVLGSVAGTFKALSVRAQDVLA